MYEAGQQAAHGASIMLVLEGQGSHYRAAHKGGAPDGGASSAHGTGLKCTSIVAGLHCRKAHAKGLHAAKGSMQGRQDAPAPHLTHDSAPSPAYCPATQTLVNCAAHNQGLVSTCKQWSWGVQCQYCRLLWVTSGVSVRPRSVTEPGLRVGQLRGTA